MGRCVGFWKNSTPHHRFRQKCSSLLRLKMTRQKRFMSLVDSIFHSAGLLMQRGGTGRDKRLRFRILIDEDLVPTIDIPAGKFHRRAKLRSLPNQRL